MDGNGPLLICYDGSEGSKAALQAAVVLFADRDVLVTCYWQPFAQSGKRLAIELLELVQDADSINEREAKLARELAEEGAALARAAGRTAAAEAIRIDGPVDEAILTHADEIGAVAIALGSRSRTNLRSLLLGDIANEVAQRATRPVLLAPSTDLSRRRREERTRELPTGEPGAG
jgi:nucleotide-binding universal stress UspA family protein